MCVQFETLANFGNIHIAGSALVSSSCINDPATFSNSSRRAQFHPSGIVDLDDIQYILPLNPHQAHWQIFFHQPFAWVTFLTSPFILGKPFKIIHEFTP